jgi:uncharacterized membrane protein HdeD (DUF308 family)
MENNWMPKVAGILDIVAGSIGILMTCFMALWFAFISYLIPMNGNEFNDFPATFLLIFMIPFAIFMLAAGILAIVGGVHALKRKKWGLALAGSIGALFAQLALGVVAIIFTVMGKKEFE